MLLFKPDKTGHSSRDPISPVREEIFGIGMGAIPTPKNLANTNSVKRIPGKLVKIGEPAVVMGFERSGVLRIQNYRDIINIPANLKSLRTNGGS